jgi:hypothetical protein
MSTRIYVLSSLLQADLENNLDKVKGIGFKQAGGPVLNRPERLVPRPNLPSIP